MNTPLERYSQHPAMYDEISLLDIFKIFRRHKRAFFLTWLLGVVLVGAFFLMKPQSVSVTQVVNLASYYSNGQPHYIVKQDDVVDSLTNSIIPSLKTDASQSLISIIDAVTATALSSDRLLLKIKVHNDQVSAVKDAYQQMSQALIKSQSAQYNAMRNYYDANINLEAGHLAELKKQRQLLAGVNDAFDQVQSTSSAVDTSRASLNDASRILLVAQNSAVLASVSDAIYTTQAGLNQLQQSKRSLHGVTLAPLQVLPVKSFSFSLICILAVFAGLMLACLSVLCAQMIVKLREIDINE